MGEGRRPVGDTLVLMVVGTLCLSVLGLGGALVVVRVVNPSVDVSAPARVLAEVLATLMGVAAGYLAGSSRRG